MPVDSFAQILRSGQALESQQEEDGNSVFLAEMLPSLPNHINFEVKHSNSLH